MGTIAPMPAARLRVRAGAAACALVALSVAGCDDAAAPRPPVPLTPNPSPVQYQPSVFLLRSDQMAGYHRSGSEALSPAAVASEAGDPSLAPTLTAQGYVQGARWTYQPASPGSGLPFLQVVSQAALFAASDGAARNETLERMRNDQPPSNGGTISTVTDIATPPGVDTLAVYRASSTLNGDNATSWLAVMRHGRVVAELFAGGTPTGATQAAFTQLLAQQAARVADAPA